MFTASVDESITLTLSSNGTTCVDLEWTALQRANGDILRYEVIDVEYVRKYFTPKNHY